MTRKFFYVIGLAVIVYSCATNVYSKTNKSYKKQAKAFAKILGQYPLADSTGLHYASPWVATTNFNMRKPNYVIIHHTAQTSCEQTLQTFTKTQTQVSAHYVICKDGTVHHMLSDYLRAWHAGAGKWGNNTDINSSSIGIELDNNGFEYFTEPQINSLLQLLARLKTAFSIPDANFIGHGDIAPVRKVDPNWRFPWKRLADNGYGLWYSDTTQVAVPPDFNRLQALRIIGYDIIDTVAAVSSFKRHWLQDTLAGLDSTQSKVLYMVSRRFL